jgi:hypothetical protein
VRRNVSAKHYRAPTAALYHWEPGNDRRVSTGDHVAANLHYSGEREPIQPAVLLGPSGPFPRTRLERDLERRWLHYAFLSRDHALCMIANSSLLGPPAGEDASLARHMTILLVHERGAGWHSSQFNANTSLPLWSAFRQPHPHGRRGRLALSATNGEAGVRLELRRSSHPCTSQCAPLGRTQHFRWQSESGVLADGEWRCGARAFPDVSAVGYHERVRGHWDWHDLGGWVFGFANDTRGPADAAPPAAVVFTLIQPRDPAGASGSVMLWRDGRLLRHFPRRDVSAAVCGEIDRDRVVTVPALARLFGVAPMEPVPRRLVISARMGRDWVVLEFEAETAARIVIPSETGLHPFSVHEVHGACSIDWLVSGARVAFESRGIVEFAGGAGVD